MSKKAKNNVSISPIFCYLKFILDEFSKCPHSVMSAHLAKKKPKEHWLQNLTGEISPKEDCHLGSFNYFFISLDIQNLILFLFSFSLNLQNVFSLTRPSGPGQS